MVVQNKIVTLTRHFLTWRRTLPLTYTSSREKTTNKMSDFTYNTLRNDLSEAFCSGVLAVKPAMLVKNVLQTNGTLLRVKNYEISLKKPCYVVGFGKAVLEMALAVEQILCERMKAGIVSVPIGHSCSSESTPLNTKIQILEGASNNLPDEMSVRNTSKILELVQDLDEDDTLLVLISGGGSALLSLPLPSVTLAEKLQVIKGLANAGGDILHLNCVRKRLSLVKGGGLVEAAYPARVISLILSDVIGDPLDFIASGPTLPNTDPPNAAWQVICKFGLEETIPKSVKQALLSEPPISNFTEEKVNNILLGNNSIALQKIQAVINAKNYSSTILSPSIEGNVCDISTFYAMLAAKICTVMNQCESQASLSDFLSNSSLHCQLPLNASSHIWNTIINAEGKKGICIISGGETTVKVVGKGLGGRNQELALRFAEKWREFEELFVEYKVGLLSAGTDGIDGPTNAAGAFGYAEQVRLKRDFQEYLCNNDSYSFYSAVNGGEDLIITGHTGTNVMDIHILVICRCGP